MIIFNNKREITWALLGKCKICMMGSFIIYNFVNMFLILNWHVVIIMSFFYSHSIVLIKCIIPLESNFFRFDMVLIYFKYQIIASFLWIIIFWKRSSREVMKAKCLLLWINHKSHKHFHWLTFTPIHPR